MRIFRATIKTVVICSRLFFLFLLFGLSLVPVQASTSFDFSYSLDYVFYREFSEEGDSLNSETGYLPGIRVLMNHNMSENISFFLDGYYGLSHVKYDGQLQNGSAYNTNSSMEKLSYGLGSLIHFQQHSLALYVGQHTWNRHILSKGNVSDLSEFYLWDSVAIKHLYSIESWSTEYGIARLFNAGLKVDLTDQGYGVVPVTIPDGISLFARIDKSLGIDLQSWRVGTSLKGDYFPRGKTKFTGGIGLTEPENLSLNLSIYVSHTF